MWTPGYWAWDDDNGYYWVPGTWVEAPEPGLLWTPGYWGWNDGVYAWNGGYWGPQSWILWWYQLRIRIWRQWILRRRMAQQRLLLQHCRHACEHPEIRNVYVNRTVIVNNNSHVAFNGGQGGVQVRPTPQQESYMHKHHIHQ